MLKSKGKAVAAILWWKNPQNQSEEILMTRRKDQMRTFPGYYAFPGGKIDADESERVALNREIFEEVEIDLDVSGAIDHGSVTTPETHPYRFETRYFSIEISTEQKNWISRNFGSLVDHCEFSHFEWDSAKNFLEKYHAGQRLMVPPVRLFLQEIAEKKIAAAKMQELNHAFLKEVYYPLEVQAEITQLFIPSNTLPPQVDTNCFIFGRHTQEVLVVDPSPKDLEEWKKMINVFEKLKIVPSKILCTHHHIDHCSFLNLTAEHFKVPVLAHAKTWELGRKANRERWGVVEKYRVNVDTGDVVGTWMDKPIVVEHIPGHDAGHIALTTADGDFFIAGDLFQSEGSVVIGGEGSSMQQYMHTLKKLVEFNPKVLYPSHGIPIAGVQVIIKLLKHRLHRHKEVCTLFEKGKTLDEITAILYSQIPDNLFKYARANVGSHLDWHAQENLEKISKIYSAYL